MGETGEEIYEKPEASGAFRFWKRLKFRKVNFKEYDRVMREKLEGVVPMKMTSSNPAAKCLPHLEELIKDLFPRLRQISLEFDGKERVPMLRVCSPEEGDLKIYQNKH